MARNSARTIECPSPEQTVSLERLGHAAATSLLEGDFERWNQLEHRFHQTLYALSPLGLVYAETERLWLLSNLYRVVSFGLSLPHHHAYAIGYYQRMLDALAARDREALIHHLRELRERTERRYSEKLQQRLGT